MSKTWKDGAGYGPRYPRSGNRKRNDWKKEMEVYEGKVDAVFVIIDEWEGADSKYSGSEVVNSKFFSTLDEAWDALALIAEAHSVSLDVDEHSFEPIDLPSAVEYESYYILELNHG